MLLKYASNPLSSKGRLVQEKYCSGIYSPYEVDRIRVIESKAFRRLEYKTQVFFTHKEDHFRNRLTHSLEATEIAKIISKSLGLCADLAETITLAHDLGHAPFGHAGEDALKEVMKEYGCSFDHNLHTITIVTELEKQYPDFDGLNLSFEVIDGLVKHNGPFINKKITPLLQKYVTKYNLDLNNYPSLEAQISSLSDDIAYNNHDIDDGFRAGIITLEELIELDILGDILKKLIDEYKGVDKHILLQEVIRRMKDMMIMDLINNTKENIKRFSISSVEDIANLKQPLAIFSQEIIDYNQQIKYFLMERLYKTHKVIKIAYKAKRIIRELFHLYMSNPDCLPTFLQKKALNNTPEENAIMIGSFIACMSDRYAIAEYRSFYELSSSYI